MATFEFKLPDLGEGVMEGEIVKWCVQPGDLVAEDQPLVEVMTDKATVTVPSPSRGKVIKTHGAEGEMAKVHSPLVTFEAAEGSFAQAAPAPGAHAPVQAAPVAEKPVARDNKVLATPLTRRMAREHGLDLAEIAGTGPQGRVTKVDVVAALGASSAPARVNGVSSAPAVLTRAEDQRIPLKGLRKKIAEKMVRSKFTAPHFTFVEEMDGTELVALRQRLNAGLAAGGEKTKLSFLPFILKALVAALKKYPLLNANFDEAAQELVVRSQYNIGMAVATEDGLTVAVVKDVDTLSIRALAEEVSRLGEAARQKKLKMDELTGGTFTVTSLGQTGGLFATPIINHPEVAILGVHRLRKRPVVKDDAIVIREMMHLSLSFDHRVIDGSVGAEFTYEIIKYLERPELLFLSLT